MLRHRLCFCDGKLNSKFVNNWQSYEDEPHQNRTKSRTVSESWDENGVEGGNIMESSIVQDYKDKSCSRKVLPFGFSTNLNQESHHICDIVNIP